jgi:hypothetical protein
MKEKKEQFLLWVKNNRKELIVVGISITALICIILGLKNKDNLIELWNSLKHYTENSTTTPQTLIPSPSTVTVELSTPTRTYTPPKLPFDVTSHLRTLPDGKHHSAEKAIEASMMGIDLLPNQTLVDSYKKNLAAA